MTSYNSAFSISNDPADLDYAQIDAGTATVWPPSRDAKLTRSPRRQADGEYLPFDGGAVYRRRSATFTAIGIRRDISAPSLNTKSKTKAAARAVADLAKVADQDHRITCAVDLPSAVATKIKAGMAINFRSTYLPGYMGAYRACRIVHCQAKQSGAGSRWILELELVPIVDGDADVVTVLAESTLAIGNGEASATQDWASNHGVTPPSLTIGKQYRIVSTTTTALNIGTGLTYSVGSTCDLAGHPGRSCDISQGVVMTIMDSAGGGNPVDGHGHGYSWTPSDGAARSDLAFFGIGPRFASSGAGVNFPCGFPAWAPVGASFTGDWLTFNGPATVADLYLEGSSISGFFGHHIVVTAQLQERT